MMNRHIRMMIDEIFCEMKMTAENLALRDELLANAQARFDDAVRQGKQEAEAFAEVAESLGDVQALLEEMNAEPSAAQADCAPEAGGTDDAPENDAPKSDARENEEKTAPEGVDLSDALNKAFAALGDWGQQVMPQAKKFVRQMDDATGGMIRDIGRAAQKGLQDAQKAAEETLGKLSGDKGELVFDFGPKKQEAPAQEDEADALRNQAADLRAQAGLKDVIGDAEAADELRRQADALEAQALAAEQAAAMAAAMRAAQEAAAAQEDAAEEETAQEETENEEAENEEAENKEAVKEAPEAETAEQPEQEAAGAEETESLTDENGDIIEDAFTRAVDDMARTVDEITREAGRVIGQAAEDVKNAVNDAVHEADYIVRDANEPVSGAKKFPAAGLHKIDIRLDADDVCIEASAGNEIETLWEARSVDGEPAIALDGHTLTIRRKNPDVFKTFFSVFQKQGGKITVRVPAGYAAEYAVSTTSGDVLLRGLDADDVKITTTSGCVRVETLTGVRAEKIAVTTVSGHAAVSACADDIAVTTVSGDQFISCDACKVDVNVVSGKVHVEGACDEWEIDAVSGDVELLCTVAPARKIQIASMHGTVRIALPQDIRGFVAQTNSKLGCPIINEFGPDRYGTCALPIRMDTLRGQLVITRL